MIKRLAIIVVNARSEPSKDYGTRATPPGLLDTLFTLIGTPIDSTSFLPPRNSIWALITRILCPRASGGEQIRWQDRGILR